MDTDTAVLDTAAAVVATAPATLPGAAVFPFPRNDNDRLRLALRKLEAAVAEQALAVAEFRNSIGALRQATSGLAGNLQQYSASLDGTAEQVKQANRAALKLQATAEKMALLG